MTSVAENLPGRNRLWLLLISLPGPVHLPSALNGALTAALGFGSAPALVNLLFALPVTARLCLATGG